MFDKLKYKEKYEYIYSLQLINADENPFQVRQG